MSTVPWRIAMVIRGDGSELWERNMGLGTILLVIVILMLVGVLPTWPHARSWGYGPTGIAGIVLLIVIILLVTGRL